MEARAGSRRLLAPPASAAPCRARHARLTTRSVEPDGPGGLELAREQERADAAETAIVERLADHHGLAVVAQRRRTEHALGGGIGRSLGTDVPAQPVADP